MRDFPAGKQHLCKYTGGLKLDRPPEDFFVGRARLHPPTHGILPARQRPRMYASVAPIHVLHRVSERCSKRRVELSNGSSKQTAIREGESNPQPDSSRDVQLKTRVDVELGTRGRHRRIRRI
jgi:hypothetical protein